MTKRATIPLNDGIQCLADVAKTIGTDESKIISVMRDDQTAKHVQLHVTYRG